MRVNEFAPPVDEDKFTEEDINQILDIAVNGQWDTLTIAELIAHNRKLCGGSHD